MESFVGSNEYLDNKVSPTMHCWWDNIAGLGNGREGVQEKGQRTYLLHTGMVWLTTQQQPLVNGKFEESLDQLNNDSAN